MEKLKPTKEILNIGIDGAVIFTPSFKLNEGFRDLFLRVTKSGERTTKTLKIPYLNDKKNCFSIKLIDDYRGKGLLINISFPKFFNKHNLYFTDIKYIKRVLKVVKKKMEKIGIQTKIKNYEFLDFEIGYNVLNSDMVKDQKRLFQVFSKATKKRHAIFGRNITDENFSAYEEDRITGRSSVRGKNRHKNYCKTNEMLETQNIELQMNVTRSELSFSKKEIVEKINTSNCLNTIKHIKAMYKEKIDRIFNNIELNRDKDKRALVKLIKDFKKKNVIGLPKFLKSKDYFDKTVLIEALEELHQLLNRQSARYIKIAKEEISDQMQKFNEIKERLENFFCIGITIPMQSPIDANTDADTENKGVGKKLVDKIKNYFNPLSKIEEELILVDFEE